MYKLIDSSSFFIGHDDPMRVIDFSETDFLEKRAADEQVLAFVKNLKPQEGKFYLHINAMGAGEYYGCNRNADYFPESNLKRYFNTFETGPAHLFRHHINKDPRKAYGKVIFSLYNERMHRVELIVEADRSLAKDIEDRIAKGDFPATSMACKTPYDECSICGNKARNRDEYCSHIRYELGRLYPDGRRVMTLNTGELRFFDISIVIKPADITSSVLQKVANDSTEAGPEWMQGSMDGFVSSAEAAEDMDLLNKYAELKKFSELIKEIPVDIDGVVNPLLDSISDPSEEALAQLAQLPLSEVCKKMAEMNISPSLHFLAELSAKRKLGDEYFKGAGRIGLRLALHFSDDLPVPVETVHSMEKAASEGLDSYRFTCEKRAEQILSRELLQCSLHPDWIMKRASEIGYAPVDFKPIQPDWERARDLAHKAHSEGSTDRLLEILVSSGIAAVAAKSLISRYIINKATQLSQAVQPSNSQTPTKILLVKAASVLTKLAQDSLQLELKQEKSKDYPSEAPGKLAPEVLAQRLATGAIRLTHAPGSRSVATAVGQIFRGVTHEQYQH